MWSLTASRHQASRGFRHALAIALTLTLGLGGCTGQRKLALDDGAIPPEIARIPDAAPKVEPLSKSGNPKSYVVFGKRYHTLKSRRGFVERGLASWYGEPFHGRKTSSGERYDMHAMTAAHKTLPLPTYAQVTNLDNGRQVIVRINDRGPFHGNRIIDLSHTAAVKLGVVKRGTARVEIRAIEPGRKRWRRRRNHIQDTPRRTAATPAAPRHSDAGRPPARYRRNARALYLQVGAFGDPRNARRLQTRLAGTLGPEPVKILEPGNATRQLYRVRIGPVASAERAAQLSHQLVARGLGRPHTLTD